MTAPRECLTELGIEFREGGEHHHVSDGWIGIDCPECSMGSGKFRLGLNLSGVYLSCWVCGGLPLVRTLAKAANTHESKVQALFKGVTKSVKIVRPRGKLVLPPNLSVLSPQHEAYLRSRWEGADPVRLRRFWKLKGLDHTGVPPWHVWIPIHQRGEIVSWTARSIAPEASRRYTAARAEQESVAAHTLLYGEDHARGAIILHEGPVDAWRTGPGACAVMRQNCTREQLWRAVQYPVRVVCFDSDREAQKRARRLCEDLCVFPGETHNVCLDAKDAASAPEREIQALRRMIQ